MNASASPIDGEISRFMNFSLDDQRRYRRKLLVAAVLGSVLFAVPIVCVALGLDRTSSVPPSAFAFVFAAGIALVLGGGALLIGVLVTSANRDPGLAPNVGSLSEARRRELMRRIAERSGREIANALAVSVTAAKRARMRYWLLLAVVMLPIVGSGFTFVPLLRATHSVLPTILVAIYVCCMPLVVVVGKTYDAATRKARMLDEAHATAAHPATTAIGEA